VVESLRERRPFEEAAGEGGGGASDLWRRIPLVLHVRAALRVGAPGP
jgi:hypothetical protein